MAKHDRDGMTHPQTAAAPSTVDVSGARPSDPNEQRVLAFAEQLGRIVGTIQANAAGCMDHETLNRQIEHIRVRCDEFAQATCGRQSHSRKAQTRRRLEASSDQSAPGRCDRRAWQEAPQAVAFGS